jgi:L,D-transpeptidase YcbB
MHINFALLYMQTYNYKNHLSTNQYLKPYLLFACLFILAMYSCDTKSSGDSSNTESNTKLKDNVSIKMLDLVNKSLDTTLKTKPIELYNTACIKTILVNDYETIFTSNYKFTKAADALQSFINKDAKYLGLFSKAYNLKNIEAIKTNLNGADAKNDEAWAKAELYYTDALLQLAKHIKIGRLYTDTNYKHLDTALTNNLFKPVLNGFKNKPEELAKILNTYEPKFADYDSLKQYLRLMIDSPAKAQKRYTTLNYTGVNDSGAFIQKFISRVQEEGYAKGLTNTTDTAVINKLIKDYQAGHGMKQTGKISKEMVAAMNEYTEANLGRIALTMDKFKGSKIKYSNSYVLVNIPSYYLRAYTNNAADMESKVAVGKVATKTPIMESEISDIITMPMWYVPPSILKQPGFIERKRKNPNFIVKGKTVIQKSGPGNALGEMKFNFKSGEAVYLHDTNEKWAFGASKRAVSHGCVRVQKYKELAGYITRVSPVLEKSYKKEVESFTIDETTKDTVYKYKTVVRDSVQRTEDNILDYVKNKGHHQLRVQNKIPIYIKYMTCAIRNGHYVQYADVYGYDEVLMEKYIRPNM